MLLSLVNRLFRIPVFFAVLAAVVAFGQTPIDYDAAIRDATQRYRGDIPSSHDFILLRESVRERTEADRTLRERERVETIKRYMERAEFYRPYLQEIEKTPPGPVRDRLIENLLRIPKPADKTP